MFLGLSLGGSSDPVSIIILGTLLDDIFSMSARPRRVGSNKSGGTSACETSGGSGQPAVAHQTGRVSIPVRKFSPEVMQNRYSEWRQKTSADWRGRPFEGVAASGDDKGPEPPNS